MIDLTDQDFEQFIKKENNFDVAVVGAGPAGMIAAERAAELGARVILIEKNKKSGKKIRTGITPTVTQSFLTMPITTSRQLIRISYLSPTYKKRN